jgi:iron-sulfur cluster assembly accessory protein
MTCKQLTASGIRDLTAVPRVFTRGEGKLVVDEVSLKLLSGSQVDFSTELIGSAFRVIQNPRADSGCGCGVSFNLTKKPFTAPSIDNVTPHKKL